MKQTSEFQVMIEAWYFDCYNWQDMAMLFSLNLTIRFHDSKEYFSFVLQSNHCNSKKDISYKCREAKNY